MKHPSQGLVSATVLMVLLLGPTSRTLYGAESLEARILRQVARDQGIPSARLELGSLWPRHFPLTGVTLVQIKLVDTKTGEVYSTVTDSTGTVQSLQDAQAAERDAYDARFGRLHPVLYERLQASSGDALLPVAIWLRSDELTPLLRPEPQQPSSTTVADDVEPLLGPDEMTGDRTGMYASAAPDVRLAAIRARQAERRAELHALQQANRTYLAEQVAAVQEPLLDDLEALGIEPTYVSPYAPLLYVEMSRSAILELAQRDDVDTLYGPNKYLDLMDVAKPTQKADVVDAWGFDGTGIDVAILEDSRIEFGNPYLDTGITRVPGHANVDDHATATAGMVASQHSTYQGIAQGVNLYSANATDYSDSNLAAAMDWAVDQDVDIINNSYGGDDGTTFLSDHDRHLDYIVRYFRKTVVVSAGNDGNATGRVGSPARGYNVISVGNYQDQDTLAWTDDLMASSSSYVDPSTGVEKPEVAASGSSINSTITSSPWVAYVGSGTSYAAPMVTGEAALLMDRDSDLQTWPEVVKAIIIATALHNIEGDSRLSEIDGAGGVDMRAAFRVVDEGWWHGNVVGASDFPYSYDIHVTAGETVRAAIAWDSHPDASYASDPLEADIDLHIYAPGGSHVTSSISSNSNYEVVEFVASATGNYELRIDEVGFAGTSEYVGAAWWPGHRSLAVHTPETLAVPPVSYDYLSFDAVNCWNAVGIRPASGSDHDLYLFANSAFADPNAHDQLASSIYGTSQADLVLVDGNHAASGSYYPEVRQNSGSGDYTIEWAPCSDSVYAGSYGPYTMTSSQLLRVWDSNLDSSTRKYFYVKPVSGDADLVLALYDSDPGSSSTWYQSRSQVLVQADAAGPGEDEYLSYQAPTSDRMGLVVWNGGATSSTTFYLYADTTAPAGSISIDGEATYTTSTSVNLSLSASDAQTGVDGMRFSDDGTTWTSWEPYATSKSWTLPSGDGSKTVYVQFRNNAGMTSSTYLDDITLDGTAPVGSISIDGGATYATSTTVNLSLSASDATSDVDEMRFSNDGSSWNAWQAFASSESWTLPSGDGNKVVHAQYRDYAGNISSSYSDEIILDTTTPAGSIAIDDGAAYATSTSVNLTLSANDATSGVSEMRFSDDGSAWGAWQSYASSVAWTLPAGDGGKAVHVEYRDHAGHVSPSYSDGIILDTVAAVGSIVINGGDAYATSTLVNLTLSASDATSGVDSMRFSNDGVSWSAWQSHTGSKSWTLPSGDGNKTVHVQFRDHAGNISSPYNDEIILDTTAPAGSILIEAGASYATSASVNLALSASDATSGVDEMHLSNDGSSWSAWEPYASSKNWTLPSGDGNKTVHVEYRDHAGHVSPSFSDSIILDTVAPTGSVLVNAGDAYATSSSVDLTLSASDSGSGAAEMRFRNSGGSWGTWEPYGDSRTWTLSAGDGSKTVYVEYRDHVGRVSSTYSDSIILDTVAPTGSLLIDGGSAYATTTSVNLTLAATDSTSGLDGMRFSDDGNTWTAWEPYDSSKAWTLPSGDGNKIVYVEFRDQAEHVSSPYSDSVILDTAAPVGTIVINSGDVYAPSTSVILSLSASDAGSGVDDMRFSDDGTLWSGWEPYASSKEWTLPTGDGSKAVYVEYRDHAGRVSESYADGIVLDTVAPEGSLLVDAGAAYAISTLVSLSLSASDAGSGVTEMHFSDDGESWSAWEPYATNKAWTLPSGDGSKAVFVEYRDPLGHVSVPYSDSIILDTAMPVGSIVIDGGATYATSISTHLTLSASDGTSGVDTMRFLNDGDSWGEWEPYTGSKTWLLLSGDGPKTVYAQFRDRAGHVSVSYSDSILLDTVAPTGSILINSGDTFATSTSVSLTLSADDGMSGPESMRFSSNGTSWSTWEPYATSRTWSLSTGDGSQLVFVQYRDRAGLASSPYSDSIVLDTVAPTGSVLINAGDAYATSTLVNLTLSANDAGSGLDEMRFSDDDTVWNMWEPYTTSKTSVLPSGDGPKTIYVQYRDPLGHTSSSYHDDITLDTAPPISSASSPTSTTSLSFTVDWLGSDHISGIATYDLQYRLGNSGTWTDWLSETVESSAIFGPDSPLTVETEKTYYFRVRARDNAGNLEVYRGGDGDTSTSVEEVFMIYLPLIHKAP